MAIRSSSAGSKPTRTVSDRIPYDAQEWKAVDVEGVPAFYLFKDGKLVGKRSGWPAEGNKAGVLALLESVRDRTPWRDPAAGAGVQGVGLRFPAAGRRPVRR